MARYAPISLLPKYEHKDMPQTSRRLHRSVRAGISIF